MLDEEIVKTLCDLFEMLNYSFLLCEYFSSVNV